jgi:hypothetical protein
MLIRLAASPRRLSEHWCGRADEGQSNPGFDARQAVIMMQTAGNEWKEESGRPCRAHQADLSPTGDALLEPGWDVLLLQRR